MKKGILFTIMMLSLAGTGVGVFLLIRKKNSPKVQSTGKASQVISDKLPQKNILSQKIVNEAIVTETVGNNTIVERENRKPVIISSPVRTTTTTSTPRTPTSIIGKRFPFMSLNKSNEPRNRMISQIRKSVIL